MHAPTSTVNRLTDWLAGRKIGASCSVSGQCGIGMTCDASETGLSTCVCDVTFVPRTDGSCGECPVHEIASYLHVTWTVWSIFCLLLKQCPSRYWYNVFENCFNTELFFFNFINPAALVSLSGMVRGCHSCQIYEYLCHDHNIICS